MNSRFNGPTHLLLRELLASPHLADLMALVVPARRTVPAVVFALTAYALSASLSLLLRRLVPEAAVTVAIGHTTAEMMHAAIRCRGHSGDLTGTLHVAGTSAATAAAGIATAIFRFHGTGADFSALLFTAVDADRSRGRR